MKKLLLGLGTITAIATPAVAVVSCSMGSVFKAKINSVKEAKEDVSKILTELSENGTLANDIDKYTSAASAEDVMRLEGQLTNEDLIGMTFDGSLDNMKLIKGDRNWGFADWTGTHNNFYSDFKVTLKDGSTAYVSVLFKYDKTNGIWARGHKGWLLNGAIAAANYVQKLKHVISAVIVSKDQF